MRELKKCECDIRGMPRYSVTTYCDSLKRANLSRGRGAKLRASWWYSVCGVVRWPGYQETGTRLLRFAGAVRGATDADDDLLQR